MQKTVSQKVGPKLKEAMNIEFLFTFTQELMINSIPEATLKKEIKEYDKFRRKSGFPLRYPRVKFKKPVQQRRFIFSRAPSKQRRTQELGSKESKVDISKLEESIMYKEPQILENHKELSPQTQLETIRNFDLNKINPFIDDPTITSIECPGPGKFILIKKSEQDIVTKVSLNEKEINEIIQEFIEMSNTPVESEIVTAQFGNLMLTAIKSDIIGSRFIIEKS